MAAAEPLRSAMFEPAIRKLLLHGPLDEEELAAFAAMFTIFRDLEARRDIVVDGASPSFTALILEGIACRYRSMKDGKRQILSLQIAGDICDLHSFLLNPMDHAIGTITRCRIAQAPHRLLRETTDRYPRLARALWRDTLLDAAIFREWMISMGRRSAYARIAHLLCELLMRMRTVGLAPADRYQLPLTQAELGDAVGLSIVHVNRVLQQLRGEKLISVGAGVVTIHNWEGLTRAADFSSAYLHRGRASSPGPD
jgi:CRP-like cAMP-binding protein